jgi:site-specific DNA recombinase
VYEGRQPAIVDQALWDKAQALLSAKSASREQRPAIRTGRLLSGRLFDDKGNAMSSAYTTKRNGQRYRYYVSQALLRGAKAARGTVARVPAREIERLVAEALEPTADGKASSATSIGEQVDRVVMHTDRIEIMAAAKGADREVEHNVTIVVKARLAYRNRAAVLDDAIRPERTASAVLGFRAALSSTLPAYDSPPRRTII